MNKFELFNDEPLKPSESETIEINSLIKLKSGWRALPPHLALPAQGDPRLDESHTFKVTYIYNNGIIHVESIESKHQNVLFKDWVQLNKEQKNILSPHRRIKLKNDWINPSVPRQNPYLQLRQNAHLITDSNTFISNNEYDYFRQTNDDPRIDIIENNKIIFRGFIEKELIDKIYENLYSL